DIRDVVGRIQAQLALHDNKHVLNVNEPVVIVAPEILPSQALTFDRMQVAGIITETGGSTGHAAILARSLGIPAVSGLRGILRAGASGVGLYRTEYLFLTHPTVPDEEEQLANYRAVIEAAPNHRVTIRTLDLGGDKQVPYLAHHREANPFMGWRSIRLSSAHPEFFQTQLRAILRAGLYGQVSLLFPMISTLEEVQRLKRVVQRTRLALQREGKPFGENVPLGVMLEVPAAALCIDALLDEVDFVSIGSNDL